MIHCIVILITTLSIAGLLEGIRCYFDLRKKAKKAVPKIGNKLRAFEKTASVINSCRTQNQLYTASNMIDAYWLLYGSNVYWSSLYDLWSDRCCYENLPQSEEWQLPKQ